MKTHADAAVNQPATCCFLLAAVLLPAPPHFGALCLVSVSAPPAGMNEARADGAVLVGGGLGRRRRTTSTPRGSFWSPLPLLDAFVSAAGVRAAVTRRSS